MDISKFNYQLQKELIANSPTEPRDSSKLLIFDRKIKSIRHDSFFNLSKHLTDNDVLVFNNTKVFPARLFGKKETGGKAELLLLEDLKNSKWKAIHRGKLRIGDKISFGTLSAEVVEKKEKIITVKFDKQGKSLQNELENTGITPLPPYIKPAKEELELRKLYQTIYAQKTGSAAAPTAGLHFTKSLIKQLKENGIKMEYVTLHVGLDTFAPVKETNLEDHVIHSERFTITKDAANRLNKLKRNGRRITAVGTTTTRVLETALDAQGNLLAQSSSTELFIYPPYEFQFVDSLITNFHLPKSTLIAMVSAFVSEPNTNEKFTDFSSSMIGKAYQEAIKKKYRFYSFGDAMLIT